MLLLLRTDFIRPDSSRSAISLVVAIDWRELLAARLHVALNTCPIITGIYAGMHVHAQLPPSTRGCQPQQRFAPPPPPSLRVCSVCRMRHFTFTDDVISSQHISPAWRSTDVKWAREITSCTSGVATCLSLRKLRTPSPRGTKLLLVVKEASRVRKPFLASRHSWTNFDRWWTPDSKKGQHGEKSNALTIEMCELKWLIVWNASSNARER